MQNYSATCVLCGKAYRTVTILSRTKYAASEKFKNNNKSKKLSLNVQGEILFGIHPIQLALTARRRKFYKLYVKQTPEQLKGDQSYINLSLSAEGFVEKQWVNRLQLDKLSSYRPHQGVCLDASKLEVPETNFDKHVKSRYCDIKESFPIWLLPYRVKDPMNLGAVLRSSYFLGVDHVILPTVHTCPLNPIVSKASAGAMEMMDISQVKDDQQLITFLQEWKSFGGKVVGANANNEDNHIPIHQYKVKEPTLLIVGNEEKGIEDSIFSMCDSTISIHPAHCVHPLTDSLNVSVATGILLHQLTQCNRT